MSPSTLEGTKSDLSATSGGLARSAGILGLGNIASRVIGLARESVISGFFGASGQLDAFRLAARVPTMIYDLLVGGMLSAALVPVFSEYSRSERRDELAKVASAVFSLIALAMSVVLLFVEIFAGPLAGVLSDFENPELQQILANCLRVIAPAVLLFGLTGGVTGLLYALRRFSFTAMSGAVFNLGIVVLTPLLAGHLGIYVLPLGIVAGSLLQLIVTAPALRDLRLRFSTAWGHPAVRRIGRLYIPIAVGLIVTQFQIILDGRWASATGEQSVSWMAFATTLIQLPLGLVPVAVSLAALPSLSQFAAEGHWDGFREVFGRGLRLVVVLLIPATVGLWVLAHPIIELLFQHGNFSSRDTLMTARALRFYLLGLPFAGVDFLLNYTFYARQNTRTPATVGVISIGFYFVTALLLKGPLGFLGLVLADSAKQATHAAIMVILLLRSVGRLHRQDVLRTLGTAGGVALLMGAGVSLLVRVLTSIVPDGKLGALLIVLVAGGAGGVFYLVALRQLGIGEVTRMIDGTLAKMLKRTAVRTGIDGPGLYDYNGLVRNQSSVRGCSMAKQKKVQPRRVSRALDPRMYGDGKPSATTDNTQPASQAPASAVRSAGVRSAGVPSAVRSTGAAPRTSTGASGSYLRGGLSTIADYTYVKQDLRRLGIMAAAIIGTLVVLGIVLP